MVSNLINITTNYFFLKLVSIQLFSCSDDRVVVQQTPDDNNEP